MTYKAERERLFFKAEAGELTEGVARREGGKRVGCGAAECVGGGRSGRADEQRSRTIMV